MNWEKISKYVTGEMNADERLAFEAMMITQPEYQEAVKGALSDLDAVDQFHAEETRYDTDEAWKKLEGRMEASSNPNRKPHLWMRYAAAVAVLLVIGFVSVWRYHPKVQTITMIAELQGERQTLELPDGSSLVLNYGAEVAYPKQFTKNERRIHFNGEGYFEIQPDKNRPFIIEANDAVVTVLGTSFNVKSSWTKTEILVTSGTVSLRPANQDADGIVLTKGEVGQYENDQLSKSAQTNKNQVVWITQQMVFERTPLPEVIRVVENAYGVQVALPQNLPDTLMLTSTFDKEPLEIILESIGKSFNLTYQIRGQNITFSAPE